MAKPTTYELEEKICPSCEYTSDSMKGVRQHHKMEHGESIPNLICNECDEPFFSKGRKRRYCDNCKDVIYKGSNNPNYSDAKKVTECEECEEEFSYYPSSKKGKFCSDCVENAPAPFGPSREESNRRNSEYDVSAEEYYDNDRSIDESLESIGTISEKTVELKMEKLGVPLFKPTTYMCQCDYVAQISGEFYGIQVKTGRRERGCTIFDAKRKTVNKTETRYSKYSKIDAFVIRDRVSDSLYWVSSEEVGNKHHMCLRVKEPLLEHESINWAEDYELEDKIDKIRRS